MGAEDLNSGPHACGGVTPNPPGTIFTCMEGKVETEESTDAQPMTQTLNIALRSPKCTCRIGKGWGKGTDPAVQFWGSSTLGPAHHIPGLSPSTALPLLLWAPRLCGFALPTELPEDVQSAHTQGGPQTFLTQPQQCRVKFLNCSNVSRSQKIFCKDCETLWKHLWLTDKWSARIVERTELTMK